MADISIEVNEINVVSVERSTKGYLSLSVKAQVEGRAETVKNSKCIIEDRQNWSLCLQRLLARKASFFFDLQCIF